MWKRKAAALVLAASTMFGCVPTATYRYTVRVSTPPDATAHAPAFPPVESDAVVRVGWAGRVKEVTIPSSRDATTIELTERLGSPIVGPPQGLAIRITKPGYKPWEARYRLHDFIDVERDSLRDNLFRADVVLMQPVSSTQPSAVLKSVP